MKFKVTFPPQAYKNVTDIEITDPQTIRNLMLFISLHYPEALDYLLLYEGNYLHDFDMPLEKVFKDRLFYEVTLSKKTQLMEYQEKVSRLITTIKNYPAYSTAIIVTLLFCLLYFFGQ